MIFKLILLIMLCIPIGSFQLYLVLDIAKDLKKSKKTVSMDRNSSTNEYSEKDYLRVAR